MIIGKIKRVIKQVFAVLLCTVIVIGSFDLSAFAATDAESIPPISSEEIMNALLNAQIVNAEEDGIIREIIEISDDYPVALEEITVFEKYMFETSSQDVSVMSASLPENPGSDDMLYLTQKWLNQNYGNIYSGFGLVSEDGGLAINSRRQTVFGLLRALQLELGIPLGSLADSFGPTTSSLYSQNPLRRQDGVTNKKFAILQGALWCKGYSPGHYITQQSDGVVVISEVFDASVEQAIFTIQQDAGIEQNGIVSLNLMKALMSMDSFKLLPSSYGSDANVRAFQQKMNRKYEAYTGLNPCDGVYGRNTNMALVYALQAEEGLPIGTANGNFGVTTTLCCPEIPYAKNSNAAKRYPGTSAGAFYTNAQISSFTELLQFSLYVNGFGNGNFDGVFDPATQQALRNFQRHHAIKETGKADKGTWMSLFTSRGDRSRSAIAADCATILTAPKAQALYNNGYRYIGRYLTGNIWRRNQQSAYQNRGPDYHKYRLALLADISTGAI